ncbi:hypothetical protein TWF481_000923 [Arthrobotrys musiformis]|uniref:Uncharacterized protein n=1 Tax=Arthrobotrys musiformis TaxID=47236 RepID=A0AAV9WP05_9PEZI
MEIGLYFRIVGFLSIILCNHVRTARADDGDEFSNNLFSDLAPLLALFGEQVAKQFLSQSLSWLDCVIFAMAPLGIITAIVSAIRVGGPTWLRAVIGRAREGKGDAELELMSSTSHDVCELWNGKSVIRAVGSPYVTEIFWLEEVKDPDPPRKPNASTDGPGQSGSKTTESHPNVVQNLLDWRYRPQTKKAQPAKWNPEMGIIFNTEEAQKNKFLYPRRFSTTENASDRSDNGRKQPGPEATQLLDSGASDPHEVRHNELGSTETAEPANGTPTDSEAKGSDERPDPPNISLNILGDPTSKVELVVVAFITTTLQLGVIAFEIAITYLSPFNKEFGKGGKPPAGYACPLTAAGTLLVMIGMFICAMVVQWKSKEEKWYFNEIKSSDDPAQHRSLDGKEINSGPKTYRLRLAWLQRKQRVMDQTFDGYCLYPPEKRQKVVYSHFNNRFTSQHSWTVIGTFVSVAGFILQFTGLRGMNYLASLVQLAIIGVATLLRVMIRRHLNNDPKTEKIKDASPSAAEPSSRDKASPKEGDPENLGARTFDARYKLQKISKWPPTDESIQKQTDSLVRAIQEVAQYLHRSGIKLKHEFQKKKSFEFTLPIAYSSSVSKYGGSEDYSININIEAKASDITDSGNTWADLEIDRHKIEAILTLWASSSVEEEKTNKDRGGNLILLGPASEFNALDYEMFISHETPCLKLENGLNDLIKPEFRISREQVFGYVGDDEAEEHLAFKTSMNVLSLRTRHILTCCLNQLFQNIQSLKEQTVWSHRAAVAPSNERGTPGPIPDPIIHMGNSHLDEIIDILHNSGIEGTRQELLTVLVPTLQKNGNLLRVFDAFSQVIQDVKAAELGNFQPQVSMEEVFRICIHAVRVFRKRNHWLYVGDTLFGLLRACRTIFGHKHKWTISAYSLISLVCRSIESQIYYEIAFRGGGNRDGKFWSTECQRLALRCQRALGEQCPEYKMFWMLHSHAGSLIEKLKVTGTDESTSPEAATETTAVELPVDEASVSRKNTNTPTNSPTIASPTNTNEPLGYPEVVWRLIWAEDPKYLFDNITMSQGRDRFELVSQALNAAAEWGRPRVVKLCIINLLESFRGTTLSIESLEMSIAIAASAATKSQHGTVIDLMLSTLCSDTIKELSKAPHSIPGTNYLQKFFGPALEIACQTGSTEILRLLLSGGLNPGLEFTEDLESLPLYLAARGGCIDIFPLLFFYGVSPIWDGFERGYTFLHHAAKHGAKSIVDLVVSPKLNLLWLLFAQDNERHYPLETAIVNGHESFAMHVFEAMLKNRQWHSWEPELETERSHGQSILHLSCMHDLPELAKTLINHGFQPRVVDEHNYSAFQIAAVFGSYRVGKVLLEHDKRQTISQDTDPSPILLAASSNKTRYLELLLENGADIETRDQTTGYTPLLAAAADGSVDTVTLILDKGADIFAKDRRGRTVVDLVMTSSTSSALKCLDILFDNPKYPKAKELIDSKLLLTTIASKNDFKQKSVFWVMKKIGMIGIPGIQRTRRNFDIVTGEEGRDSFLGLLLPKPPADVKWGFSKKSAQGLGRWMGFFLMIIRFHNLAIAAVTLDEDGNAPLVYAAGAGCEDACVRLLKYMDTDSHKGQLERALHMAFYGGRVEIVRILINVGIDANDPLQESHLTPLSLLLRIAAVTRKNSGWERLLNDDFDTGPWENDFDLLECLNLFLKPGMEVAPTAEELKREQSLIHLAIMCKSPEVLDALVRAGVDINLPREAKRPLIHFALSCESRDANWIPVLCHRGVDINAVDKDGKTAFFIEVENSNASAVNALIENGATWGQDAKSDVSVLIKAIKSSSSSYSLFSLLCARLKEGMPREKYRKHINSLGHHGSGIVHIAAEYRNDNVLEFLWREGVDMRIQDRQGRNALSYALESQSTMQLLMKLCGISPNEQQTDQAYTAAHFVVRNLSGPTKISNALQVLWDLGADFNIKDKSGKTPADYIAFASHLPRPSFSAPVPPNPSRSSVIWEESLELSESIQRAFNRYRSGGITGLYSVKEQTSIVCRSNVVIPTD